MAMASEQAQQPVNPHGGWDEAHLDPPDSRHAVLVTALGVVAVVALFWPTVMTMLATWLRSRTFAHGLLVVPTVAYLVWSYRDRVRGLAPRPSLTGFMLIVLSGGAWVVGELHDAVVLQQAAVLTTVVGFIWSTVGTEIVGALAVPLGFLVFALPVGTELDPVLQRFTAAFVMAGLTLTGIPVHNEGMMITIPSGVWEVARDCGGLRYLLPGLALGYVFAAVMYQGPARRLGFLALCAAALMLANGIRAYGIIVGDHTGVAEGTDHRVFSYAVYGVTVVLLLKLGLRWQEPARPATQAAPPDLGAGCSVRRVAMAAVSAVVLVSLAPLSVFFMSGTP
jgi:exosortase A